MVDSFFDISINIQNSEFGTIRTLSINNEPWFVGKDVAEILGYTNASKAVAMHVDDEDKRKEMLKADSQNGNVVTQTALINESGLYSLILSSKLPKAKEFKRWVTSEVLPSIRKTGGDSELEKNILNINNVHGYLDKQTGTAYLNAEDVARGFGFTENKGGVEYVMWRRVNTYLREFGFRPNVGER